MVVAFGLFLLLFGLVHLYYCGCSQEVSRNPFWIKWPGNSYLFTYFFGSELNLILATLFCLLAAVGFITSGILVLLQQSSWNIMLMNSALLSSAVFALFWDGDSFQLGRKGGIIVMINLALLISQGMYQWPHLDF